MIEFPNFIFSCPPCCGADWFINTTRVVGLDCWYLGSIHSPCTNPSKYYTSIVRHPYSWLKDFYFSTKHAFVDTLELPEIARREKTFESFIRCVTRREDAVKSIFDLHAANSVMRFEDMPWAFLEFLESVGVVGEGEAVTISTPPLGYSAIILDGGNETELQDLVLKSERQFCEAYNYFRP